MSKSQVIFVCAECGGESIRWSGQCPHCRAWNTLEEVRPRPAAGRGRAPGAVAQPSRPVPLNRVDVDAAPRLRLAWDELNRVLGGGVVPGSVVLLGGEPGVGKSTLLTHLAEQVADSGATVLYTTGEESAQQVALRARRLGATSDGVLLLAETDLDAIIDAIDSERPAIAIVDSIQTVHDATLEAAPGSVSQVREATGRLLRLAKGTGVPVVLVGHVTKEGAIAGPRVLEHMVDAVLSFEGERGREVRVLRAQKNRFGSTEEIGIFAMTESGLREISDPSSALLEDLEPRPGTVVLGAMEGSRPLLLEMQALVSGTSFSQPRRSVSGLDLNRLFMLVAVLEKRASISLGGFDVIANVAGGIRVTEPAADLPLALAIAGGLRDVPLAAGTVVIGEVGLGGEVRRVARLDRRLQEAARHGFSRAIVPPGAEDAAGLRLVEVTTVGAALAAAFSTGVTLVR
jgi:DNA repair protein RadA/Sms